MIIPPERAWRRIERRLVALEPVAVGRAEALGLVLAEPLRATLDVPAHDVSAMDGYALAGPVAAGDERPLAGVVAAGDPPGMRLPAGAAVRIMTGAPVPAAADRVVPVEHAESGPQSVVFHAEARADDHIRRQGEVQRAGSALLPEGHLLTPGALSLLAAHGHDRLRVRRPPTVAVLSTGDEVIPPELEPRPGQLRDSNTDFLTAAGRGLGLRFRPLGIAPDRPDALAERIAGGLAADVLLVCGGVSKGEFDFVESVLEDLGCELLFDQVGVQPGKPLVAARHDSGWVFGLPGNPGSVMVCFWLFVRPLLRRLLGRDDRFWGGALAGTLAAPLPGAKDRDRFLPAEVETEAGSLRVRPAPSLGSHDVASWARGTALVRVPARSAPAAAGERCEVLPIA